MRKAQFRRLRSIDGHLAHSGAGLDWTRYDRAERIEALLAWVAAAPLPKPLFVGIAAGHAALRKMSAEEAVARLGATGIAAFTDPIAMVRAVAQAVGTAP